jgi:TldD protein
LEGVVDLREKASWPQTSNDSEGLTQKVDLLLAPDVSAVLIHELVGHGSEEVDDEVVLPMLIGPDFLQVTTYCPASSVYDDEGIPISELCLIKNGKLLMRVADREHSEVFAGRPSGLAQAGTHGGKPRVRCTHLKATGGSGGPTELISSVEKGILCLGTSGGEFYGGTALIRVSAARYIEDGILGDRAPQFFFPIHLSDFRHRLTSMANDESFGRTGICQKDGDALPTLTCAPTMLLSEVHVRRASDGLGNS